MKVVCITIVLFLLSSKIFGQSFVSPVGFVGTDENKQKVIAYIEKDVKAQYSAIGMDDPSTLRMMENENLKAFKELTQATNISLLNGVIKTYCDIGMCNYTTILMMYNEQNKASKEKLKW